MGKRDDDCVRVLVRCRPMSEKEKQQGHKQIVQIDQKICQLSITNPKVHNADAERTRTFTFDSVYGQESTQEELYEENFRGLVSSVLTGFNGTVFAYGQTGTGKTFTMEGIRTDNELKGMIPRAFDHIFTHISRTKDEQYLVRASYLEIYQEDIRDLLSKDQTKKLALKERSDTGVQVKDLLSYVVKNVADIEHVMNVGNQNRSVGATNMNEHSSRSHAIFTINIECSSKNALGEDHIRVGRLNMVDLAGSERQAKTGAAGQRLKEATKINLSLSALGNVISALVDGRGHIPYRDSKLTRLLQDSLGGNAKTIMIANLGPANFNYDETITTLRYANRAKSIKNIPKINEDPKDAMLREFQEEIEKLKHKLAGRGGIPGGMTEEEILELKKKEIQEAKHQTEEEKAKLIKEAKKKAKELEKQKENQKLMEKKLKTMQEKLLIGGVTILDRTTQQEKELEVKRAELAEQRLKEREIEQKLEEVAEKEEDARENFNTLQQEVDIKTRKLKKIYSKLQNTKAEIDEIQEEHRNRMRELEQNLDQLMRESKLCSVFLDNFIQPSDVEKIEKRAYLDKDKDIWRLKPLASGMDTMLKRPVSALGNKRPLSRFSREMAMEEPTNPRYRCDNILILELELPTRTTRDWEGPDPDGQGLLSLENGGEPEADEMIIQASPGVFRSSVSNRQKSSKSQRSAPKSSREHGSLKSSENFPKSRGLVPR